MKKQIDKIRVLSGLCLLFCLCPVFGMETAAKDSTREGKDAMKVFQGITVKGYVRDAVAGKPLLGAKVQSKGQEYSAITDENGYFKIEIPEYLSQLYLSAPDYVSVQYPLQGKTDVDVCLYKSVPPMENLSSLTVDGRIQSLLAGDVRTITHSGAPGMGASMFIRGYNSLNVGAQPLIVLDGIIFDNQYDRASIHEGYLLNPLSSISMEDIENIQVIKDGTALYGSKGGNGVVLIDTKRGKSPVTQIQASTMYGYNLNPKTMPVLNADQFKVYVSDIMKGYYTDPSYLASNPFLNEDPDYFDYQRYHNNHGWSDDVYRNSSSQSYNVSVSGGDDVALYNLSMGFTGAGSTLKNSDFSRFNTRFNTDMKLTQKMNISFDLSYSQTDHNLRNDGFSVSNGDPTISSPGILSIIKSPLLIPYEYVDGHVSSKLSGADFLGIANPVAVLDYGKGESSQNFLSLTLRPSFQLSSSVKASGSFNYSMNNLFEKFFRPATGVAPITLSTMEMTITNYVQRQNAKQIALSGSLFLNWKKKYGVHAFDVAGGFRYYSDSYKLDYGSGYNTATDLDYNLGNTSSEGRVTKGADPTWRTLSWYATGEYSLKDKYVLSGIITADASSRFGADADLPKIAGARWGFFPSVNAAWIISSEKFMKNLPFVDYLKLNAGYALAGNDNIPELSTISYFGTIRYIKEYSGLTLSGIGNTNLKMETVRKANAGLDLALFRNRVSMSFGVYRNVTSDLLSLKRFDYIAGKDSYWANAGKLENKGYELSLNMIALALNNFQWEIGGSVAHYKNKILSLPDGDYTSTVYGGTILTSVGNPAGLFYGYRTKGVFATTAEASASSLKVLNSDGATYTSFGAGDIRFDDVYKDGVINEKDRTVIGDPNPELTGSFNTRVVYKRLTLSALFTFSYGNDVYNYLRSQIESGSTLYNQSAAMQNRWVSEGQVTSIPKVSYGDPMGNSRFSDRWIEDGSYLRFKTLSLSYDVPLDWMFLSGFTVWASANNLCTFSKYLGTDPEFSISNSVLYQGIDSGLLSQGRSFFFGLKLKL